MNNSKTMMKKLAVALLAGACLSGCAGAPASGARASGESVYGPPVFDRATAIEPAVGIGDGRSFHDDHDRW